MSNKVRVVGEFHGVRSRTPLAKWDSYGPELKVRGHGIPHQPMVRPFTRTPPLERGGALEKGHFGLPDELPGSAVPRSPRPDSCPQRASPKKRWGMRGRGVFEL